MFAHTEMEAVHVHALADGEYPAGGTRQGGEGRGMLSSGWGLPQNWDRV